MTDFNYTETMFETRRPYLNESVVSSRQSVLSQDMDQQFRMYSRMLKQISKEVSDVNTICLFQTIIFTRRHVKLDSIGQKLRAKIFHYHVKN